MDIKRKICVLMLGIILGWSVACVVAFQHILQNEYMNYGMIRLAFLSFQDFLNQYILTFVALILALKCIHFSLMKGMRYDPDTAFRMIILSFMFIVMYFIPLRTVIINELFLIQKSLFSLFIDALFDIISEFQRGWGPESLKVLLEFFKRILNFLGCIVILIILDWLIFRRVPWSRIFCFVYHKIIFRSGIILCVGALILNAAVFADARFHTPAGPNIIVISVDTLRYDALGVNGSLFKDITPHIDRFAAQSVQFRNCMAPSSWTLPSHMSLLSGLYPESHQMDSSGKHRSVISADPSLVMLAEVLRNQNYHTHAITGGGLVSSHYGFSQGFAKYDNGREFQSMKQEIHKLRNFFKKNHQRKFFLFFQTYAVHAPYVHTDFLQQLIKNGDISRDQKNRLDDFLASHHPTKEEFAYVLKRLGLFHKDVCRYLYYSGVHYMDQYIGELMETLDEMNLLNNTIIIFTSDHGEEFGEHNPLMFYDNHYRGLFEEHVKVPLLIYLPDRDQFRNRIVESPVSLVDIMPTLLEYLHINPVEKTQGVNILNYLDEGQSEIGKRSVFASTHLTEVSMRAIRTPDFKYIRNYKKYYAPDHSGLYDLNADPFEKNNLAVGECSLCSQLSDEIAQFTEWAEDFIDLNVSEEIMSEGLLRQLKSLGYIQ